MFRHLVTKSNIKKKASVKYTLLYTMKNSSTITSVYFTLSMCQRLPGMKQHIGCEVGVQ